MPEEVKTTNFDAMIETDQEIDVETRHYITQGVMFIP